MSKEFKFTIGADPEFNMEINNKKLNASEAITALLDDNSKFQKDSAGYALRDKKAGAIGWDGHSSTGEIRPSPSKSPQEVVENLRAILTEFNKAAPLFELSTLSRTGTVGGHIHFEVSDFHPDRNSNTKMKALHKRLISLYLPIIMGENKVNLTLRMKGGYGQLCSNSAFRVDSKFKYPNGNPGYTYELRCPSAEWLTTPKIANATLAFLGVIFHEIRSNPKKFDKTCKEILVRNDQQGDALQTLAIAEYESLTKTLYSKIKKSIKTFELYEEFKDEINYILNPNKILADKQSANYDIRIGWNLNSIGKEATKKQILSDKSFKKEALKKDLDAISKFVKISYNDDINVETFAKTLAKRSIAFNWNLNKTYFLFGIRKGISDYIVQDENEEIIKGSEQLKTILDKDSVNTLFQRMRDRVGVNHEVSSRLNFITGKIEKIKENTILIGIPYEKRINDDHKSFIELIYEIEKNKTKIRNKKDERLIDDTDEENKDRGEIWKILNNQEVNNREIIENSEMENELEEDIQQVVRDIENEELEEDLIQNQ